MANGRPGDDPLSDILAHGSSAFPDDITELVEELADLPGFNDVRARVSDLLVDAWPTPGRATKPDLAKVRDGLASIRRHLKTNRS